MFDLPVALRYIRSPAEAAAEAHGVTLPAKQSTSASSWSATQTYTAYAAAEANGAATTTATSSSRFSATATLGRPSTPSSIIQGPPAQMMPYHQYQLNRAITQRQQRPVLPEPAAYKTPQQRDWLVEQYYCTPGPAKDAVDYNSLRGITGMNYEFPHLEHNTIEPMKRTTWSLGTNRRMRGDLSSIEGNRPAPDVTCIRPPVVCKPTGATQRFRERQLFQNGQYLGARVLEGVTDFRPRTPEAVSYSPVVSRTRTRHDPPELIDDSPYPVQNLAAAGTMFTHATRRECKAVR